MRATVSTSGRGHRSPPRRETRIDAVVRDGDALRVGAVVLDDFIACRVSHGDECASPVDDRYCVALEELADVTERTGQQHVPRSEMHVVHETDLRFARPQRCKEGHAVEDLYDGVAGSHASGDRVERRGGEHAETATMADHSVPIARDLCRRVVDSTGVHRDIDPGERHMSAHLGGVFFGSSAVRGVEVTEREEMDVPNARLGGASAHGFVKVGVNEDRRRHRRLLRQLEGPLS